MSQNDLVIANQSFPATRADINSALQALGSLNSGATEPSTMYANMFWYDTATSSLNVRSEANDAWIAIGEINQAEGLFQPSGGVIGAIIHVATSSAPTGYLKADGLAVSRSTYSGLFSAIGSTFGVGDGSTTFNVPDLRGEFVRGWDDSRGIDGSRVFGSAQSDELKAHLHNIPIRGYSGSASNYGHTVTSTISAGGTQTDISGTEETANTGGTETRPRNIALLACIKY